jgi:hypothetical protein
MLLEPRLKKISHRHTDIHSKEEAYPGDIIQ